MDITNLGLGAGGGIAIMIIVYIFKYLNTHKVKIISSCCSLDVEQDRTPRIEPEKTDKEKESNSNI